MTTKYGVGIIGCGNIAPRYVEGCRRYDILDVTACADLDYARAEGLARRFDIPHALSVPDLLASPDVDIVVNLTIPAAHTEIALAAIAAGKHVHNEKPLALTRADGRGILDAAETAGVYVGCAPDTFLGGGLQTCRQIIDEGLIGQPVAATAFMLSHGPEAWHPNPDFFYQFGGGPLWDMGPYYLTALVHLLGPVATVAAITRASFPERTITAEARYGERVPVEVATHHSGTLAFAGGPLATLITSFDVWAANVPRIEIYGSEGTLSVPDPNTFGGPVLMKRPTDDQWLNVAPTFPVDVMRGIGVADLAHALASGRPHRASGALAYHVIDVMQAFEDSSQTGAHIQIASTVTQPAPLPEGLPSGQLD